MYIKKEIFKAYDIRGVYPEELNEESAKLIAHAYLKMVSEKVQKPIKTLKIVVGRDIREASAPLTRIVIETFLSYGIKVDDIGLVSINDYYFACGFYKYDGGIMATASHNPPEYGGFKMVIKGRQPNSIEFISGMELYDRLVKLVLPLNGEKIQGRLEQKNIFNEHLKHILSFVNPLELKPFKVVIDAGNGMNGLLLSKLFKQLPGDFIPMFFEPDGKFPNRPPNPLSANAPDKLSQKVLEEKADIGFIYDVDGDRMFLVDELGNFIRGDKVLLMMVKPLLIKNPGAGIVYNLICSKSVPELVEKWGGRPIRSEVGYKNCARHMLEEGGIMSGEVSGHFAFKGNYYADSAFIAFLLVLKTLSDDGRKLSEILKEYSLYARGDEINIKVDSLQEKLEKIRTHYKDNLKDEIDGITVEFSDYWFNVRASNTEPLLRITVEAKNQEELIKRQEEVLEVIGN